MKNSDNQPLVSIVVPVYNAAAYLPEMLDSVLGQTYGNLEVVCVNDGSSDASLEVLRTYADRDARVAVIDKPNSGAGDTRNRGIAAATGEYLCFVDSDDFIEPNAIESLVAAALDSGADAVIFDMDFYSDETGEFSHHDGAIIKEAIPARENFEAAGVEHFYKNVIGYTVNKLYRTSLLAGQGIEFPKIGAHEDMPFTYVALSAAGSIYYLDEVLYHYRRGREGSLSDNTSDQYRYMVQALSCFRGMLAERGLWERNERNFVNYALHMCRWKNNSLAFELARRFREDCRGEFFGELGISDKAPSYFYNPIERKFREWVLRGAELPFKLRRVYNACIYVRREGLKALRPKK